MPDDPALGDFREQFAGMLGLIEERPDENEGERTSFAGTERVISSENLTDRLEDGPEDRVDAEAYLTARIEATIAALSLSGAEIIGHGDSASWLRAWSRGERLDALDVRRPKLAMHTNVPAKPIC